MTPNASQGGGAYFFAEAYFLICLVLQPPRYRRSSFAFGRIFPGFCNWHASCIC